MCDDLFKDGTTLIYTVEGRLPKKFTIRASRFPRSRPKEIYRFTKTSRKEFEEDLKNEDLKRIEAALHIGAIRVEKEKHLLRKVNLVTEPLMEHFKGWLGHAAVGCGHC